MGPNRMREMLIVKHHDCLDAPFKVKLRQAIIKFIIQIKKGTSPSLGGHRRRKSTFPIEVLSQFIVVCRNKTEHAWKKFVVPLKAHFEALDIV